VRAVLTKELLRLLVYSGVGISAVVCFRIQREKPVAEGVTSASIGALAVALAWLISAIRTVRAILREHGYLDR
jgi:hypothetical protein